MKLFRGISAFILSLILSFILVFIQFSLFVNTRLLKPDFYISKFEKHGFYDYIYDSVYKNFGQVSQKVNLPAELFKDIVTKDWIKSQTDGKVEETIDYMLYKRNNLSVFDIKPQSDSFNVNIDNYIKELKVKLSPDVEKEITGIKSQIGNIIKGQVNFIDITSISKNSTFQQIRKALYLTYSSKVLILVITLIITLLLSITACRGISNIAAWLGYVLIAGGFFTFVPSVVGTLSGFMNNISISEGALKQLAVAFIKDFLNYFSIIGGMIFIVGILLTFSSAAFQAKYLYK